MTTLEEINQMEQLIQELAQMSNAQDAFAKVDSLTKTQKEVLLKLYVAQPHKQKKRFVEVFIHV